MLGTHHKALRCLNGLNAYVFAQFSGIHVKCTLKSDKWHTVNAMESQNDGAYEWDASCSRLVTRLKLLLQFKSVCNKFEGFKAVMSS